jgi:uncharacterized coiled-coil protein SlyX
MSETISFPQDTPIRLASIKELTTDQLSDLVEKMQERRMRSYTLYEEAMKHKAEIKDAKDRAQYQKRLDQFEKKLKTVDAGLTALSKYVTEIQLLRLTVGDLS